MNHPTIPKTTFRVYAITSALEDCPYEDIEFEPQNDPDPEVIRQLACMILRRVIKIKTKIVEDIDKNSFEEVDIEE